MKDLESKLAERDAMIRVLQKHTYDKESSSSSGVGSYPAAHSSHSSTSADHHTALTSTPELGKFISSKFMLSLVLMTISNGTIHEKVVLDSAVNNRHSRENSDDILLSVRHILHKKLR